MSWDVLSILLTGAVVAASCALLGSFLVLRKMAMLGDAISHAVLPGIVLAFLLTMSRGSMVMFVGAVLFGLLTTFLVQFLSDKGVQGDAAIGVSFTFLFAVGVVLISLYGQQVDLDLDCVLYGEIAYTPFDVLLIGDTDIGPRPLWINSGLLVINLVLVLLFYKQFKICSFDPGMAAAVGINVTLFHYLLMLLVSVTAVGAFESVGAILVVAMLIVPGAAAYLLTDRLSTMLWLAVGIGIISAIGGYFVAGAIDASIAGSIASLAGICFGLAFVFSPSHGLLSKWLNQKNLRRRVTDEDALLWAWRHGEQATAPAFGATEMAGEHGWKQGRAKAALGRLRSRGLIEQIKGLFRLNAEGRKEARKLIRRHRLFESYLVEQAGYAGDHVHGPTDRMEHYIDDTLEGRMEHVVEDSERDPHGKEIPRKSE